MAAQYIYSDLASGFEDGSSCTLAAGDFLPHMPFAVAVSQHLHEDSVPGMIQSYEYTHWTDDNDATGSSVYL